MLLRCLRRVIGRRPACKMAAIQWPFSKYTQNDELPEVSEVRESLLSCFCFFQKCQPLKSHGSIKRNGANTRNHPLPAHTTSSEQRLPFVKDTAHIFRMTPEQGFCVGSDLRCTVVWSRAISGRETRENCHSFTKNFQGRGDIHAMSGLLLVPQIDTLELGISETKHHIEV